MDRTNSLLVAFANIDPIPNQSGSTKTSTSKCSSPYLRKALFNVMNTYIKTAPKEEPIYQFLDRKRSEGKPYYVYMTAGANKCRYYAKVRDYLNELEAVQKSPMEENNSGVPPTPDGSQ